jgi:hypothetical protein
MCGQEKGVVMKKRYVFAKDLKAIENQRGQILKSNDKIFLVKTSEIYTVWAPESGLIFCHTFYENEALETFEKYTK